MLAPLKHLGTAALLALTGGAIAPPLAAAPAASQPSLDCLAPAWLLSQSSAQSRYAIFSQPIARWITFARPAQRQAIQTLTARLGIDPKQSLRHAVETMAIALNDLSPRDRRQALSQLQYLLVAVGTEWQLQTTGSPDELSTLANLGNPANTCPR